MDALDPLVEAWPLSVGYHRDGRGAARLLVQSADMLNVNITPSAFRCALRVLRGSFAGFFRGRSGLLVRCCRPFAAALPCVRLGMLSPPSAGLRIAGTRAESL